MSKRGSGDGWEERRERAFWGLLVAVLVLLLALVLVLRWVVSDTVAWVESRFGSVVALALVLSGMGVAFGVGGAIFGARHTRATAREAREDMIDGIGTTAGTMGTMAKVALEGARAERAALAAQVRNEERLWTVAQGIGRQYGRAQQEAQEEARRLEDAQGRRPTSTGGPRIYD